MNTSYPMTLALALALAASGARGQTPAELVPADATMTPVTDPNSSNLNGSIDAGALHDKLTGGFPSWNGEFLRGVIHTSKANTINLEVNELAEFGAHGQLYVAGDTLDLDEDWFASVGVQGSSGGFFLPRDRFDLSLSRKWLEERKLVTTIGFSAINAKDDHRDRAAQIGLAYYFTVPWVIEAGERFNRSNPGNISAPSTYVAVTYGREKDYFLSLRFGTGREAYQLIGASSTLVDFHSNSVMATWRQWIGRSWGAQLRGEDYRNPLYRRDGVEAGLFADF